MASAHLTRRLASIKGLRLWTKFNNAAALSTSSRAMGGGGIPDDLPIKGRSFLLSSFTKVSEVLIRKEKLDKVLHLLYPGPRLKNML